MTYRIEFRERADQQTVGLPDEAFVALIEALGVVSRDPFDPKTTLGTEDIHVRRVAFGNHGEGLASFFIAPEKQIVSVFDVTWTG
jgi:hypothetical protein